MKDRARAQSKAIKKPDNRPFLKLALLSLILLLAFTAQLFAQEKTTISHGYSRFGDLKYPADFTHLEYANPNAPKGGEMSLWALGSFDNIHRFTSKGEHAGSATIFFETLMAGTADEVGSIYGLLAETIEYPESLQWAIFKLRPEAKFSDGTDVKASDVVFTHNILKEKGLPFLRTLYKDITSVEALDEDRIKFTFTEGLPKPILSEQISLAAGTYAFSEAWWNGTDPKGEPRDFAKTTLEAPLGTGPYVLDKMDTGRMISYKYNPDYWGKDLPMNVGQNNFETLRYEYYGDSVAALEGFKAGNYTFRAENSSKVWATGYDFPAVEDGSVIKTSLPNGNLANAQNYVFNLRLEKFQDPRVREAIGLMFNFEWANKTLFFDLYARVTSFWGNSELEATGAPSEEEKAILIEFEADLPEGILTDEAYVPPVSSPNQLDRKAVRAANKLLDDAGWPVGDDGIRRNAAGEKLTVDILYFSPAFTRIHEPYVENLKRIGVDALLTKVDSAQYSNRLEEFDFEMITQSIGTDLEPGLGLRQWFSSESANINTGNRNLAGFANPAVDAFIEKVIASETREELVLNTKVLDRSMRALRWGVPQWFKDVHTVAYWDIFERPETIPPYALGAISLWWYNEEKAAKLKASGAL